MPFTDVINNYANGATGTLTDAAGDTVGYTISGTSPNTNWQSLVGGARVNANGTQSFNVAFDKTVIGAAIRISGSDANERYFIVLNGVTQDLNTLIANGDATLTQSGAQTHVVHPNGSISGGHHTDGSIADIVFHIPVTSIGAFGTNGNSGNWDFFDVGIDATSFNVVCFADGTAIGTGTGETPVEALRPGDLVTTAQGHQKPILWKGTRHVTAADLGRNPKLRPVRISAGALGRGLPRRDLLVSPQHRILVCSRIAKRMFGVPDVLVAAIRLTVLPGIHVDRGITEVTYHHLLLDRHDLILAEGAPSESLFTGPQAMATMSLDARREIAALFPELGTPVPARPIPTGAQQKQLLQRHAKHARRPLDAALPA